MNQYTSGQCKRQEEWVVTSRVSLEELPMKGRPSSVGHGLSDIHQSQLSTIYVQTSFSWISTLSNQSIQRQRVVEMEIDFFVDFLNNNNCIIIILFNWDSCFQFHPWIELGSKLSSQQFRNGLTAEPIHMDGHTRITNATTGPALPTRFTRWLDGGGSLVGHHLRRAKIWRHTGSEFPSPLPTSLLLWKWIEYCPRAISRRITNQFHCWLATKLDIGI